MRLHASSVAIQSNEPSGSQKADCIFNIPGNPCISSTKGQGTHCPFHRPLSTVCHSSNSKQSLVFDVLPSSSQEVTPCLDLESPAGCALYVNGQCSLAIDIRGQWVLSDRVQHRQCDCYKWKMSITRKTVIPIAAHFSHTRIQRV